jgi:hypothetical protein
MDKRALESKSVLVSQNTPRNLIVIIRIEKNDANATKQAVLSVIAFTTSKISLRRLDSLLDL